MLDISSTITSPVPSPGIMGTPSPGSRPQPTAYVIAFPHPLTSVCSHPSTSKEFLVSDCRGSIFLTDWRSDPEQDEQENWRHSSLIELVEPFALSDASTGLSQHWSGSVAWRGDSIDMYNNILPCLNASQHADISSQQCGCRLSGQILNMGHVKIARRKTLCNRYQPS